MNQLDALLKTTTKVLVVCLGNTCRSPAGEAFIRKFARDAFDPATFSEITIESAGLSDEFTRAQPQSIAMVYEMEGESLTAHRSRMITRDMADYFDLILIMERYMADEILHRFPGVENLAGKLWTLKEACSGAVLQGAVANVVDPYMTPDPYYRGILAEIRDLCRCFVNRWAAAIAL
jgi:protein-tyrosine phosphatase